MFLVGKYVWIPDFAGMTCLTIPSPLRLRHTREGGYPGCFLALLGSYKKMCSVDAFKFC